MSSSREKLIRALPLAKALPLECRHSLQIHLPLDNGGPAPEARVLPPEMGSTIDKESEVLMMTKLPKSTIGNVGPPKPLLNDVGGPICVGGAQPLHLTWVVFVGKERRGSVHMGPCSNLGLAWGPIKSSPAFLRIESTLLDWVNLDWPGQPDLDWFSPLGPPILLHGLHAQ